MTAPDADDAGLIPDLRSDARAWEGHALGLVFTQAADMIESQRREIEELRRELAEALKVIAPFAVFAVNVDADGWISNIHRERISTWFGPSDFRAASAFAAKHGGRE